MLTEEQLAFRKTGIGASEIGSVLGIPDAFATAYEVYLDKINPAIKPQKEVAEMITWGNLLEPVIADRYAHLHNLDLETSTTIRHPKYPYLIATPDRLIKGHDIGIEIKTVGPFAAHKFDETVPLSYLLQCAHSMLVKGYKEWRLVVLMCGQELREFTIHHDKDIEEMILDGASKFWHNHVEPRIAPPIPYHHPKALELMKLKYPAVLEEHKIIPQDIQEAIIRWEENKQLASQYQKAADAEQAMILDFMKESSVGELSDGRLLKRSVVKIAAREQKEYEYIRLNLSKGRKK